MRRVYDASGEPPAAVLAYDPAKPASENAVSDADAFRIQTLAQLRERIGEPNPMTRQKVFDRLDDQMVSFLARSPICLLATRDADGGLEVSPKGDGPGFARVEDAGTLVLPDRKGNKLIFGLQNLLTHPGVGLIFLVPGTDETLRINGRAELRADPDLLALLGARPAGAGRDPRPRRALLLPLRARVPARGAVEPEDLARAPARLVRKAARASARRRRGAGREDRRGDRAGPQRPLICSPFEHTLPRERARAQATRRCALGDSGTSFATQRRGNGPDRSDHQAVQDR
jgi:predicted pyridoxine 5'-phosphate oxidase superfamily flavin-nucleotide-binding protein